MAGSFNSSQINAYVVGISVLGPQFILSLFQRTKAAQNVAPEGIRTQVHTYKVSHGYFHSVWTYMITRKTSVFASHSRRGQCVCWAHSVVRDDRGITMRRFVDRHSARHLIEMRMLFYRITKSLLYRFFMEYLILKIDRCN